LIVLDATLAITFGAVRRLDLLSGLQRHDVGIAQRAAAEVLRQPARSALDSALEAEEIRVFALDLDDPVEADALLHYDALPAFRGRGDAEVLALASARKLVVGSDDRAVRTTARRDFGSARVAGTLDVLVWAMREGRLTLASAGKLLDQLDVGPGIRMRLEARRVRLKDLL